VKISTILDHIDLGEMALPEFQRGYVWNRDQVRGLMESLYRKHPVGTLLVWSTRTESAVARGESNLSPGYVKLLLDGQQRVTSLYGIIRGKPPEFFDGNPSTFLDLYFNIDEEIFEFYGPVKMKDNPAWIKVTDIMQKGIGPYVSEMSQRPDAPHDVGEYVDRLNRIVTIKDRELHIEDVSGEDKTVDVVVDIFNRVNSGGTKLSKGDLALAKICANWPEARGRMKELLGKWQNHGFDFKLEWLLRCVNTYTTGEALFNALRNVSTADIQDGLNTVEKYIDYLLNLIGSRLGLDHDRVLGSRYSFATIVPLLKMKGGRVTDPAERDKLLYWYIHTFLWGRYTGSTESIINQDLAALEEGAQPIDALIERLRQNRGDLAIQPNDFMAWSRGARFYPLLYMLTRVWHAKDWETGIELSNHMLGSLSQLQMHHIFPKALLYQNDYAKREVNALANFTFLTQETNLHISDRPPEAYLSEYADKDPSVIESHWIPLDRNLWKVENYADFLQARRELLAKAANDFLGHLLHGEVPEFDLVPEGVADREPAVSLPGSIDSPEEEQQLIDCNEWVEEQGYAPGEFMYELVDENTGRPLALLDLAWPNGMQEGLSDPVALLMNEERDTEEIVSRAGFRFFTSVDALKEYVAEELSVMADV